MNFKQDQSALTDTIATVLSIAIAVAAVGGVGIGVYTQVEDQTDDTLSDVDILSNGNNMVVRHKGGDPLDADNTFLIVYDEDGTATKYTVSQFLNGESIWSSGQSLCIHCYHDGAIAGISVMGTFGGGSSMLAQSGSGSTTNLLDRTPEVLQPRFIPGPADDDGTGNGNTLTPFVDFNGDGAFTDGDLFIADYQTVLFEGFDAGDAGLVIPSMDAVLSGGSIHWTAGQGILISNGLAADELVHIAAGGDLSAQGAHIRGESVDLYADGEIDLHRAIVTIQPGGHIYLSGDVIHIEGARFVDTDGNPACVYGEGSVVGSPAVMGICPMTDHSHGGKVCKDQGHGNDDDDDDEQPNCGGGQEKQDDSGRCQWQGSSWQYMANGGDHGAAHQPGESQADCDAIPSPATGKACDAGDGDGTWQKSAGKWQCVGAS